MTKYQYTADIEFRCGMTCDEEDPIPNAHKIVKNALEKAGFHVCALSSEEKSTAIKGGDNVKCLSDKTK